MERELLIKLGMDRSKATAEGQKFAEEAKTIERKVLSDAEVTENARSTLARKTGRERIEESRKAAAAEAQAARSTSEVLRSAFGQAIDLIRRKTREGKEGLSEMGGVTDKLTSSLSGLAAGAISIGALSSAARSYLGVMGAANKEAQTQLDKLLQTKDLIREIALITGSKEGPSDREVQKFMDVRKASGLTNQEAKENIMEFEGSAASSKGINISEAEYERLKPMQARFAAAAGGGPDAAGTYGKLAGLLVGLRKFDKAEDVLAGETQFNRILSRGVGDNPTLIKQAAQVAGAYVKESGPGIVRDERELASMVATASKINPETVADTLKSTTRVLRGTDEKWAPLLKQVGISEKDTYSQALGKLSDHLDKVEKSGRTIDTYLAEQGVDQHGAVNIASMHRYRGFLTDAMADESTKMTGAAAVAELDHKFGSDITLQIKQKQASVDEARMMNAVQLQPGRLLDLEAERRLELRGEGATSPSARAQDLTSGKIASGFGLTLPAGTTEEEFGRKIRMEREKKAIADERGVELPNRPNDTSLLGSYTFEHLNWLNSGLADQEYSAAAFEMQMQGKPRPALPAGAAPPAAPGVAPKAPAVPGVPHASLLTPTDGGRVAQIEGPTLGGQVPGPRGWREALAVNMVGTLPERDPSSAEPARAAPGREPRTGTGGDEHVQLLKDIRDELKRGNDQRRPQQNPPISGRPTMQRR